VADILLPRSAFTTLSDFHVAKEAHWMASLSAARAELRKRDEESTLLLQDILHRIGEQNAEEGKSVTARMHHVEQQLQKLAAAVLQGAATSKDSSSDSSVVAAADVPTT